MKQVTRVLALDDLDALFRSRPRPIVLNDLPLTTENDRNDINELVITTYNKTDSLSSIPSCTCGRTKRGHKENLICPYCDTVVTVVTKRELKPDVFIRAPKEVGKLMNPLVWMMFHKALDMTKGKGTNGLRWITDSRASFGNQTKRIKEFVSAFEATGLPRGFKNFVDNFPAYAAFIISRTSNHKLRQELHDLLVNFSDNIFCTYIPVPSKVAFVVEKTHVGTYYDKIIDSVIEAVFTAADLNSVSDQGKIETRISTIQELTGKYYRDLFSLTVASKPGLLRRDCYGAKINFSFRNIVTSQHEAHNYYQIQIPYAMGLVPLQPAVINILCNKHGMSYKDAYDYTEEHADDMDPLILSILNEFARTANDGKGIMVSSTRYPSLRRSSTYCLYVNGFTKDSTRLSVLALRGPNTDFDGDILQFYFILDDRLRKRFAMLEPHYDAHSTSSPGTLNNTTDLPDNTVITLFNWMDQEKMVIGKEEK